MFIKLNGKLINLDNVSEVLMSTDYDGRPELRFRDNTGETFESFRLDKVPAAQRAYDYLCSIATLDFDDTSPVNVFHFDNGDGTIGQMQITNDAPATNLNSVGEWHHTSDGTEFPTVCNDAYSFTLESFAESLNLHKVLRQYASEVSTLQRDLDIAIETRMSAEAKLAECEHAHEEASKQRDAATELYNGKHERIEALKKQMEENREYHIVTKRRLETVIEDAIEELLLSDDAGYTDYQVAVRAALKILVMYKQGDNASTAD